METLRCKRGEILETLNLSSVIEGQSVAKIVIDDKVQRLSRKRVLL